MSNYFTRRGFVRSLYQVLTLACVLFFISWLYNGAANRRYIQRVYIPSDVHYDIVAFGDSLIEGLGAAQGNGFIEILSERIGMPIFNAGIRRDTTRLALARLDKDVLHYHPKIVIISLGSNDTLRGIPLPERIKNLTEIITRIRATDARIILLGPQTDWYQDHYQKFFVDLGALDGVTYIPNVLEGILWNPKYLFDPIHPNDKGHLLIANKIEPILRMLMNRTGISEKE